MKIQIKDDFDLDAIANSGQCFRWKKIKDNEYRIPFKDQCLYITGSEDRRYTLDCDKASFKGIWRCYFDLDEDYARIRSRIDPEKDPFLFAAARAGQGIRILRQDLWETLISFIISQNRNISAITRSVELLCEAAGEQRTDGRGEAFFSFPAPEQICGLSDEQLRKCALGYRAKYVRAAAQSVVDGSFCLESCAALDSPSAVRELSSLFGIGPKVAACIDLFALHHLDAFPVDTWIKKALDREYPDGYPREDYSPYNGVYQQYMFAYYRGKAKSD